MIPNKKLSIIVPNYKNEKYLERTLKSLIEQTYKNIEIVVVCDKPEEDCDKLVKSYIEKDNRIIYIKNDERKGKFKARIQGAQKATGDYIAFLDADNYASIDFYRNAINIGLAILECDEAAKDIKAGDEVEVDFDSGVITNCTTGKTYKAQPFPPFIQNIIKNGGLMNSIEK